MIQKKSLAVFPLLLMILLVVCSENNTTTEPDIVDIGDSTQYDLTELVSIDTVVNFLNDFTGENSVNINGITEVIVSRKYNSNGNKLAAIYLKNKLKQFGLNVKSQTYSIPKDYFELTEGENIIAIQDGKIKDKYCLILAHYDCWADSLVAPGADDNASGCGAVLEAARVLSQFNTEYSIIYAFFDQEEGGYRGSKFFADSVIAAGIDLKLVIELDMIGYDGDNDSRFNLHYANGDSTSSIVNKIDSINTEDNLGFKFKYREGESLADSYPFKKYGYETLGFCENFGLFSGDPDRDSTPFYHTENDRVSSLNLESYEKIIKLTIKLLANSAGYQ